MILDITRPMFPGMGVYSPEEGFSRDQTMTLERDGYRLSYLHMGAHCGTHMDAPAHFLPHGAAIDQVPLDLLTGPALVVRAQDLDPLLDQALAVGPSSALSPNRSGGVAPDQAKSPPLERCPLAPRLLIRGQGGFSGLTLSQARRLAEAGVRLLGTELLSVAQGEDTAPVHRLLLEAGVWLVESLDLSGVQPGRYRLTCLPLRVVGAEGAPARAILEAP